MREEILKRFFQGLVSASQLSSDLAGSTKHFNSLASRIEIEDMQGEFRIDRPMLVALCDAVLSGTLKPDALNTIGFALTASDSFTWDGDEDDVLANVISDWSCPEINYALTLENIARFRRWLLGEEAYPTKPVFRETPKGKPISVREKLRQRS